MIIILCSCVYYIPAIVNLLDVYSFYTVNSYYFKFQLLSLQVSAEKYFFNIRKSLVEFDEVLEVHTHSIVYVITHM